MRFYALSLVALLLTSSNGAWAQTLPSWAHGLPHARMLFADSVSVPPFPYRAEADSVAATQRSVDPKYYAEPQVTFSAVLDDGREVPISEYWGLLRAELPAEAACFIGLTVEWNGAISSAYVVRCREHIPDDVLIPAVRRVRAKVVYYGAVPFPVQWSMPFPPRLVP